MSWDVTATNDGGSGDGSFEIPPAGNHAAVLIGLIDLGTQDEEYKGKHYRARKAMLVFELTAEHKSDGTPFVIAHELAIYPKMTKTSGLRKFLEAWRGKPLEDQEGINLLVLLGKPCLANVIHKKSANGEKTYANLGGVSPIPKGYTVPKPANALYSWSFDQGPPELPSWVPRLYGRDILEVIDESYEARGRSPETADELVGAGVMADDDIPF